MYSSMFWTKGELSVNNHLRVELEPLLMEFGVDLAFWGHMHCYERTCPTENGVCKGDLDRPYAPVHFVVGTGGRDVFFNWLLPNPRWSQKRVTEYGYVDIKAPNRNSITITFVEANGREERDSVTIKRNDWWKRKV